MKKLLLTLTIFTTIVGFSQSRKSQFQLQNNEKHQLLISFDIKDISENPYEYYYRSNQDFRNVIDANKLNIKKAFQWDEDHFERLQEDAKRISGSDESVKVLKGFYIIKNELANGTLYELAERLEGFSFIRYAELNSLEPIQPPFIDIPPVTPNYSSFQTYIQSNPGVNMQYAWNLGIIGQGIRVRDIEYGMSVTHEELTSSKFSNQLGINSAVDPSWLDHGTATAGIVAADNGAYGITGMQHGISEFKVYPEYSTSGYNRLFAINSALNNSVAGDVVLYEMQTGGVNATQANPNYVPAEYVNSIWDVTKAATDAGIHIIAAAGNGNQNLDAPAYANYKNRGDSGALMVGAGSNTTTHSRLSFSTYGQRVNVQGWGMNVLSTGYGDYAYLANDPNQTYTMFSGTSSATPVVASCVIALLSRAKQSNVTLTPVQVRQILVATGIAQGGDTTKPIGPLPNMMSALNHLDNLILSTNTVDTIPLTLYPNPTNDQLFLLFPEEFSKNKINIFDLTGRLIMDIENYKVNEPIDVSHIKSGTYILKMESEKASQSKKIMIK